MTNWRMILLAFYLAIVACNKEDSATSNGILIGIDFRKCASPMCGGWFVEIEGDTLRFFETPEKTNFDLHSEIIFPVPVKIEWMRYENEWKEIGDLIKVHSIFRD
ncbi:MAG: hypothetical protein IPL46_14650 [Saprospiraceae bacterium]|nr:hypothetical protein [Saprospiraceae bacterium]